MIGFYDYTVILTYISFASSISGIFLATRGHFNWAIFCLAFSGLCDMFDGKIARTKKNRTEDEKRFGIQIDSLCDVVCFGVFPIVLCYELGMTHFYSIPILVFYGLAGVIRLGYFNVMEEKRQNFGEPEILPGTADYLDVSSSAAAVRLCTALPRILSDLAASAGAGGRRSVYHGFPLPQADE